MSEKISETRRKLIIGMSFIPAFLFDFGRGIFHEEPLEGQPIENFTWNRKPPEYDRKKVIEFFTKGYGDKAGKIADIAFSAYEKYGKKCFYDPLIFLAQIRQESDFGNPSFMISRVGAGGSTMVMPETAEKSPFKLKVHNPEYYKKARKDYVSNAGSMRRNIKRAKSKYEKISDNAFEMSGDISDFAKIFSENRGIEALHAHNKKKSEYDNFLKEIDEKYERYVDEVGSFLYLGYKKGDVKKMAGKVIAPLKMRPQSEVGKIDERFVDEIVIPKSYKEMQKLIKKSDNVLVALAAYNAGYGNIKDRKIIPYIPETVKYISWIYHNYNHFYKALAPKN